MINAIIGDIVSVKEQEVVLRAGYVEYSLIVSGQTAAKMSALQGSQKENVRLLSVLSHHAEEVTSKDGLWDIFRKSRTPNSLVNLNLEHPTGTINLDGFSSGENGTKGKMPSFSCQLNLNGADLSLTYASSSCSVQGANVRLLFHVHLAQQRFAERHH